MTPSNPIAPQLEGLVTRQEVLKAHGWKSANLSHWVKIGVIAPVIQIGQRTYWRMPTQEEALAIAIEMKRRNREAAALGGRRSRIAGKGVMQTKARSAHIPKGRKSDAPEGLLSTTQMTSVLGIPDSTLIRWRKQGIISPVWTCPKFKTHFWTHLTPEMQEDIRRQMKQRQEDGAVKARQTAPSPRKKPPTPRKKPDVAVAELPSFVPLKAPPKQKPTRQGSGTSYDAAVSKARSNSKWANILGFNLWRDSNTYKAESIRQVPSFPWVYCERHFFKDGRWELRFMRPGTGEVLT